MASVSSDACKCSRCNRIGHLAKDCRLPFVRRFTVAELREKRAAEAAKKRGDMEAKQAEFEVKKATWESRQAERKAKHAELQDKRAKGEQQQEARLTKKLAKCATAASEWDAKSDISEATTS